MKTPPPPQSSAIVPGEPPAAGAALFPHIRRPWAIRTAVALLLGGAALNILFLFNRCPIDLSEDESHYWEWARHLDFGYYSKGPGIAWIMAAVLRLARLGGLDHVTMPILRLPAVLFSIVSGLASLDLARRVFRDDRAALMVTVLSAAVPMFVVGALLLTIDAPMYMCWAVAVYALWRRIEPAAFAAAARPASPASPASPAWLYLAGLSAGLGALAKPITLLIPLCALLAMALDRPIRRALATWHSAAAVVVMLAIQTPVVLWNAQHHWVMFHHMSTQGGLEGAAPGTHGTPLDALARLGEYLGGQAGMLAGILFVLLVIAVALAIGALRRARRSAAPTPPSDLPSSPGRPVVSPTALAFLLAFGLPIWIGYALLSLWVKTQPNWPAASYFALMVLLAGIATFYWNERTTPHGRRWRAWVTAAVIWGVLLTAFAENTQRFYPLVADHALQPNGRPTLFSPRRWDPTLGKLRGFAARAAVVEQARAAWAREAGHDVLIASGRYDESSSLAFYLPGQPFVYCLMSRLGGRLSQYDLWPGLNARAADGTLVHAGADVLLVGYISDAAVDQVLRPAFAHVSEPATLPVAYHGIVIRTVVVRRCSGFRGFPAAAASEQY